jgi:8-oxo-dGTP pyrophosphatase MutT (NUDIX family)
MDLDALAENFAAELSAYSPIVDREARWPAALLRQRTFVGDLACPAPLATSARAVVFRRGKVVVVRQRDGQRHVNPGGRLELGESVEAAARREVLEETGWRLGPLTPLGFHHFQHIGDRPAECRYTRRDFVQPVFVAEGLAYDRTARDHTQLEVGSSLTGIAPALAMLTWDQAMLLRAAIARHQPR